MPRKALGDRPLTVAERQAHQRAKRAEERQALIEALRSVSTAPRLTEARSIATQALELLRH